jgi:hypothetical protein
MANSLVNIKSYEVTDELEMHGVSLRLDVAESDRNTELAERIGANNSQNDQDRYLRRARFEGYWPDGR